MFFYLGKLPGKQVASYELRASRRKAQQSAIVSRLAAGTSQHYMFWLEIFISGSDGGTQLYYGPARQLGRVQELYPAVLKQLGLSGTGRRALGAEQCHRA